MSRKKKLRQEKFLPKKTVKVDHSLPLLFAGTLFVSALLLFLVEPMMAKMILPLLGGASSVWNTCIVFYQTGLLAGYAYAHASSAWLSVRHQLLLHMALVVVPVVVLPLGITEDWSSGPPVQESPVIWLLLLLSVSVGLPFFILAASTPLLQKWFTSTGHPLAKDPYFLYAASNLGSMLALLGYPTIVEPLLPLKKEHWLSQAWLWTLGYGLLIALVICCAWVVGKSLEREEEPEQSPEAAAIVKESPASLPLPRLGLLTRLRWVALAFVPSSLMLGVTTFITMDIAAIPLLWIIPLALYLLSFILVFARWPRWAHQLVLVALPPLLLFLVFQMESRMPLHISMRIILHLLVMFLVALACHGELALSRPAPRYLTEFYLWLSIGGALGGLFNALVAPAISRSIVEYPIGLVLACLVLPRLHQGNRLGLPRRIPAGLAIAASILAQVALAFLVVIFPLLLFWLFALRQIGLSWFAKLAKPIGLQAPDIVAIVVFAFPLLLSYWLALRPLQLIRLLAQKRGYSIGRLLPTREPLLNYLSVRRPLLLGLAISMIMVLSWAIGRVREPVLEQTRNFYGVLKVTAGSERGQPLLKLTNGTTSHGLQLHHRGRDTITAYFAPVATCWPHVALDMAVRYLAWADLDREPLSYYHRTGPIGQVFAEFSGPKAKKAVAVIGLGTGTLASYGEPGQEFVFLDIDPDVCQIASPDPYYFPYFTYLRDCRAEWKVYLGDARLRLKEQEVAKDHEFQLMIVDAFNSDAIPVHLLTREALELYFQKLSKDGILALHISNRHLDLEPVLGNLADELHLVGLYQYDQDYRGKLGKMASQWVLLAQRKEDLGALAQDARWRPILSRAGVGVWTDDYSNLLSVFKWK